MMLRRAPILLAVLLAAGCFPPRGPSPLQEALQRLSSDKDEEYEGGFRTLLDAGGGSVPALRASLALAPRRGFPVVAILYVAGGGDEVPLELRARHLSRFDWPRGREEQNAIVVPYVRASLERDLVRTGRPALRLLAEALADDASSERHGLDLLAVMLRIGGRGAADALAPLLDRDRDLGGVRVCDLAAGALLVMGRQDLALRAASRDALVRSAREWWAKAKDEAEAEWIGRSAAALAGRWQAKDVDGVREVLELLVGRTIDDPAAWRAEHPDWRPSPAPLHPEELLPKLSAGRPEAYAANRMLEEATGIRLLAPRAATLGELCASLRLWQPPPDLETRWRRVLESRNVRLSIAVVGYQEKRETNHLLWHHESTTHCTEEPSGKLEFVSGDEAYLIYVQALDLGTRVLYGEYHESEAERRTILRELPAKRPSLIFSPSFKAVVVVSIEEVPGRRTPRPPDELFQETRRRIRRLAETSEGPERSRALRALGLCQDPADRDFLRDCGASDALLLLGDPEGMKGDPRLEPWEIEMALRKAADPGLRDFLERMKRGPGR